MMDHDERHLGGQALDSEHSNGQERSLVPARQTSQPPQQRDAAPWAGPLTSTTYPGDHEGGLDWRYLLYVLWRHKWWVAVATAAGIAAGVYLAQRTDPVYQTRATVWVESADDGSGPIQAGEMFRGQGWSDLFTSLAVLEPVVRELKLYLDPKMRGLPAASSFAVTDQVESGRYRLSVDSTGSYALATSDGRILDRGQLGQRIGDDLGFRWAPGRDQLPTDTTLTFSISSPTQAALNLRGSLSAVYDPRAGNLMTTRLSWNDPQEATQIHNQAVESFLDEAADLKSKKLREVVRILNRQTEFAEERLQNAELALENARVENVTLPTESQASPIPGAEMTRGPVFEAYFSKKLKADQLRSELDRLRTVVQNGENGGDVDYLDLQASTVLDRSPELSASLQELFDKRTERRSLLYTYTRQHPKVREVSEEIQQLTEETIPAQVRELAGNIRSQIASLEQQIAAQENELRAIPPRLIEEERLRREMEQAESLHTDLLSRLKSAELAASTSQPNLQIVDRATAPGSPTSDNAPRLFLMASLAGLGLGVAGAFLADRMDSRLRQPEEASRMLGLPVLGVVPHISTNGNKDEIGPGALEAFRSIRAQLSRSLNSSPSTTLVTSPEAQDGKSVVLANLAISFASARKNTLLIDADTRRGNQDVLFDVSSSPGLTDYLDGDVEISEILRATEIPGLVLLPHGRTNNFSRDRLEGPRLRELFRAMKERFDVVLVDSPPLTAGSDALILGEMSDQAVLVLRMGATDREVTRTHMQSLAYFDFPAIGLVLNDVPSAAPYYRYYSADRYYLQEAEQAV